MTRPNDFGARLTAMAGRLASSGRQRQEASAARLDGSLHGRSGMRFEIVGHDDLSCAEGWGEEAANIPLDVGIGIDTRTRAATSSRGVQIIAARTSHHPTSSEYASCAKVDGTVKPDASHCRLGYPRFTALYHAIL